jgi:hypothetical protein
VIDPRTRAIAIVGSILLLMFVIELVRRRRMKEEYSVLWTVTALTLLVMAVVPALLTTLTTAIGAVLASSTLFFTGLIFALLMLLHFSVRISSLERNLTALVQELGLMAVERDQLRREIEGSPLARDVSPGATPDDA